MGDHIMEAIAPVLALGTLGVVIMEAIAPVSPSARLAYASIREVEKRRGSDAPKSSLSRDGVAERVAAGTFNPR
jgi:hypothetical protein